MLSTLVEGIRDPRGIQESDAITTSPGRFRRVELSKPLVTPQKTGFIDCYFDDLFNDHVCYFNEHDYSTSHFVASCSSETFNASTCECELSTKPDEESRNTAQSGIFTFQQCDLCQLAETIEGGWSVEYNCTNIVSGQYAAHRTGSIAYDEQDVVRYEEEKVLSPATSHAEPDDLVGNFSNPGEFHREDSIGGGDTNGAFGEDSVTDNAPSGAPSSGVVLTMVKVTRQPTQAPIDKANDARETRGGNNIRRRQ